MLSEEETCSKVVVNVLSEVVEVSQWDFAEVKHRDHEQEAGGGLGKGVAIAVGGHHVDYTPDGLGDAVHREVLLEVHELARNGPHPQHAAQRDGHGTLERRLAEAFGVPSQEHVSKSYVNWVYDLVPQELEGSVDVGFGDCELADAGT